MSLPSGQIPRDSVTDQAFTCLRRHQARWQLSRSSEVRTMISCYGAIPAACLGRYMTSALPHDILSRLSQLFDPCNRYEAQGCVIALT